MAQQPSTNDELLALKKRARRRLVGAVALVLISMIVLWNVLDGEPKAAKQNVSAQGVEIISDAPQLGAATGNGAPVATPAPAMPVSQPPAAVAVEAPEASGAVTPETRKPAAPETRIDAGTKGDSPPPEKPVKHEKPKVEPKPEPAKPKPAEPREKEPVNKPADARSDDGKSHVIQVAALADADKAKALVAKLAGSGVKAYTEQKGDVTRVRVGPFGSREQAEKALARIQSAGASGMIISK